MSWVEVPFPVPPDKGGLRLDAYLVSRLHRYSRSEVQRLGLSAEDRKTLWDSFK